MAEEPSTGALSGDELQAFAAKLEAWGQGLSPKEQQFLTEILGRAVAADVQGYAAVESFLNYAKIEGAAGYKEQSAAYYKEQPPFAKVDVFPLLRRLAE